MAELKNKVPCFFVPSEQCFNFCPVYTATDGSVKFQEGLGIDTSAFISHWEDQPIKEKEKREVLAWRRNPVQISKCDFYNNPAEEPLQ